MTQEGPNWEEIPDALPDFEAEGEKGIMITCNESYGIMSRVSRIAHAINGEPDDVFERLVTLGINTNYSDSQGLYKIEPGFEVKVDLSEERFSADPPIVPVQTPLDQLPKLGCRLTSDVHKDLLASSKKRHMPAMDIAQRAARLGIMVMEDIVFNDGEYFMWEFEKGSKFEADGMLVEEAGERLILDVTYLLARSGDDFEAYD